MIYGSKLTNAAKKVVMTIRLFSEADKRIKLGYLLAIRAFVHEGVNAVIVQAVDRPR